MGRHLAEIHSPYHGILKYLLYWKYGQQRKMEVHSVKKCKSENKMINVTCLDLNPTFWRCIKHFWRHGWSLTTSSAAQTFIPMNEILSFNKQKPESIMYKTFQDMHQMRNNFLLTVSLPYHVYPVRN